MNFFQSIIVSALVVAAGVSAAVLQPQAVDASYVEDNVDKVAKPHVLVPSKPRRPVDIQSSDVTVKVRTIVGNSDMLAIADVNTLWQAFYSNDALHARLQAVPTRIYVAYQDFSGDFERARITIGYPRDAVSSAPVLGTVNLKPGRYTQVLPTAKYNSQDIESAWQTLDYQRLIEQVIEVYHLSASNKLIANNMLVLYGE